MNTPAAAPGSPREMTENMWLAVKQELEQGPCRSQQQLADLLY